MDAWLACVSVAAYLHKTSELGITYGGTMRQCCVADATRSHPSCVQDASFGRAPFPFLGGFVEWRNAGVVWFARKTKSPGLSSCELEVDAIVAMLKEAIFVVQLLQFVGAKLDGPMPVITDNKAAVDVIKCPGATKRTVHFDRRLHFARDLYLRNGIALFLTDTRNMMADFFTKPSDKTMYFNCRKYVMNVSAPD